MILKFSQFRIQCIHILGVLSAFLLFPPRVICSIKADGNVIKNVGQDAFFIWNTTDGNDISSARWGLLGQDRKTITPLLIYMSSSTGPILSNDLNTIAIRYKDRVSWVGNLTAGHAWFKLTNVTLNDTSQYAVKVLERGESEVSSPYSIHLTVAVQPTFLSGHPATNYQIIQERNLKANCTATGPPTPDIAWVNITDGSVVIKSQGSGSAVLQIDNITRYHAGVYECQAKNNPNEDASTTRTRIIVYIKPAIDESTSKSESWNGNNIRLRCIASGLPAPQISWFKPTNQQITTGVNIVPGGSEVTVLTTADQGDYGQYKCRATNLAGSDEHVINVTQLFPPGPFSIVLTQLEASSVTVKWTEPADDGGSPVIGYLLEVSIKPPVITVNTHAVITGLKANTQYTVKVYARNMVGYGAVATTTIKTKETGKPSIPKLVATLQRKDSKYLVILKWSKPDDNGANITLYTIYMKEVARKAEWAKYYDVTNPNRLEYRITKNIVYGKTYMFMVTARNKYGESVKDEGSAKTVNTTADELEETAKNAMEYCIEGGSKYPTTFLGVVIAILVVSLLFNLAQFLYLRSRIQRTSKKEGRAQTRRQTKKEASTGESYENEFELEDKTTTVPTPFPASQEPVQTIPD